MKNKGHLYFIMGTAGSGKGTLRKSLEKDRAIDLEFVKSYVTRPMREGEVNGDVYNFISEDEFKEMITNGDFLEYELVHKAAYYGTKLSDILENGINEGKKICKEVEIEGLKNIRRNNPHLLPYITTIFLGLSPYKLKERIKARGEKMTKIDFTNRAESLEKEVEEAEIYCDYIIDTSEKTPEEVLYEVKKILKK